jgi:hypothetical protein
MSKRGRSLQPPGAVDDPRVTFGRLLKNCLDNRGWTKFVAFGSAIKVHGQTVGQWCRGEHVPRSDLFENAVKVLSCDGKNREGLDELRDAHEKAQKSSPLPKERITSLPNTGATNQTLLRRQPKVSDSEPNELRYLGDNLAGIKWFKTSRNNASATHVYNTAFTRYDDTLAHIEQQRQPDWDDTVRPLLSTCVWQEIISSQYLANSQYIGNINEFHKSLGDDQQRKRNLKLKAIGLNRLPLIQCTLIKYINRREIVLIGWTFPGGEQEMVYMSSGKDTVNYFRRYCELLWELASDVSLPIIHAPG